MTDVYRTSGLPCPSCPGASLRTFANRYICDECGGLFLGFEDFESSIGDLIGEHPNPRFDYGERSTTACPRCERAMVNVTIVLELEAKKIALDQVFLRCERDGLWCAGGVLEAVFEKVSRKAGSRGFEYGVSTSDQIGPDGLPERRFVPTLHRRRPRAAPAVDPYGDRSLPCPGCGQRLVFQDDRHSCPACQGALVGNEALVAMVQNISGSYWELPALATSRGGRACPVCAEALATQDLEGVAVDRCGEHGVWFDAGELATALAASTEDNRSWFARLIKPRR